MLRTQDRSVHSIEISGTVRMGRAKTEHGVLIWQCLPMYRLISKESVSTIIIYPCKNIIVPGVFQFYWALCMFGLKCSHWNKPASQSGVVPSLHRGETKSYFRENELYIRVQSCMYRHGRVVLSRREQVDRKSRRTLLHGNFSQKFVGGSSEYS